MLHPRDFPDTRPSLLATLRDGPGQSAWREFFERYAPAVFRVARLRGLDEADADDVVQQAMLAIARHIGTFHYDRDRGRFRQWVRRIAESKIANLRRGAPPPRDAPALDTLPDESPTLDELWQQEWRIQDLLWCLDQIAVDISPRRMRAFRMYALEGCSAQETAAALDMTVGYVYVTRNQVLNRVRDRLEELEREQDGR
jgi:RNA polymerase sigma factor (sigma-70 family)